MDLVARVSHATTQLEVGGPVPPGPHFVYEHGPELFLGRQGMGPLHVAWDTNVLISAFDHGKALWEFDPLPSQLPAGHEDQWEAMQIIVATWVLRDIRFHVLAETLSDARNVLGRTRRERRWNALREFSMAVQLVSYGEPELDRPGREGLLHLPDSVRNDALRTLPRGKDSELVEMALRRGMHVFLTFDRKILKCDRHFKPLGLRLLDPIGLLEELAACGALHCVVSPQNFAAWPVPDLQRVAHLLDALDID